MDEGGGGGKPKKEGGQGVMHGECLIEGILE